ncbi:hypothetical protein WOLCODRAFT_77087 [Wolfiporia cocos MD-104 SS10]|uniref:BTB domain-containing protein n=1 Tax=Wolfiporia cocos (strain MD-104) TaxID=742152 RepID=A0A2H3K699_WOLCO|nr:hypothetical protein WOLCODRAFT_77087 [Wolfiporia cocos MD-104 SS10]
MGESDSKSNVSSSVSAKAVDFTPSNDVWYIDGSVVLVTEKTAFRVHGTIMAAHCEIFKDMFAMPQPAISDPDTETYDGCQVLRLQDSPANMKHFLKAIYDFSYFQPGTKTKFPIIAAVVHLSTKYEAAGLRQRAIDLLATAYPSTPAAWENRSAQRLVPPFEGEHAAYIALATENDIRVILPTVYYSASRQPLAEVMAELRKVSLAPNWEIFADFVVGREQLFRAELKHILAFLDVGFTRPQCQNTSVCTNVLGNARNHILQKITDAEPFHQWCNANSCEVGRTLGLCNICCTTIENSIKEGRKKVWEQLPRMFGLGDWETLRARDGLNGNGM